VAVGNIHGVMARGGRDLSEEPALNATKSRAKELLDQGRREGTDLLNEGDGVTSVELFEDWTHRVERWDARTRMALESVFDGPWPKEFADAATGGISRQVGQSEDETFEYRKEAIRRGIHMLTSIEERMAYLEEPDVAVEARPRTPGGSEVFVVHGHARELRERVVRLLERLDLTPIILEEQPDCGKTIIEKFEQNAFAVGYAVVLMTPDDVGTTAGKDLPTSANRARQNVILELGYFMGALGRSNVAALCTDDIERPSDIHGLLYIDVSRDGWELRLAKEMRNAGLPVDLNKL
jgi:predicted nucleotide-binding protein